MKSVAILFGVLLLLGGLAAGAMFLTLGSRGQSRSPVADSSATGAAAPVAITPAAPDAVASLQAEVGRLSERLFEMEVELASLRSGRLREPLSIESEPDGTAELTGDESAAFTPVQVEQRMREVFAAEREREEREAETARMERERQAVITRAERVARELSMSPGEEKLLVGHMLSAQDKRRVLMEQLRESGFDRDTIRAGMEDFRAWNSSELVRLFGSNLATQLEEQGRDLMGGGFRGGGPPDFGDAGRGNRRDPAAGGGGF